MRSPFSIACCFMLAVCCPTVLAADKGPPNIVLIMSDDMGFSDLGCYGGEIQTPHLDSLASGGLRFTQFYNMARCCPTRAALMTGLYPHQAGVGHMTSDNGHPGYSGELNRECATIAEVLRPAGYSTYMAGKWHLTRNDNNPSGDKSVWPLQRGFDRYYGTLRGAGSFYDPSGLCRDNQIITPVNDEEYQPEKYYYTDAISDNAVKFLAQHNRKSSEKPFFLYVAYTAAHWPMHALEKDIAKYEGKYAAGYEAIRAARLARLKEKGLITADTQLTTEPDAWDNVKDKEWEARCMEVYAAMIDNMDAGIGRIVNQLKADGKFDNTLILFLQDNGGCAENVGRQANGAAPASLKPLGRDEPQPKGSPPMQTRDGRWVRTGRGVMPGPADTFIAYGRDWARVSNTPFREFKHWTHEGGISTPLIAHWPAGIKQEIAGKLCTEPAHLIDIMATSIDLSDAKYPKERDGAAIKPFEGKSLKPTFSGASITESPRAIFWEHEGNRAVREGAWKLVAKENQPWELYDISVDRPELKNLAAEQPDRVRDLAAKWDAYAARADVLPLDGWRSAKAGDNSLSRERRFELKAGDRLAKAKAPAFVGKAFSITAKFDTANFDTGKATDGVLVAHGGSANGYSLYLADGKLKFSVRTGDDLRTLSSEDEIEGQHTAEVRIEADGRLKLSLDGKELATDKAGDLPKMPAEALDVGSDQGNPVGPYQSPASFAGKIESVVIEVAP